MTRPATLADLLRHGRIYCSAPRLTRDGCPCSKLQNAEKAWRFLRHRHTVVGMITILSALASLLSFRVRSHILQCAAHVEAQRWPNVGAHLEMPALRPVFQDLFAEVGATMLMLDIVRELIEQ